MLQSMIFSSSAVIALLLPALFFVKSEKENAPVFRLLLGVAVAGAVGWTTVQLGGEWRTSLSLAIWVTISASILCFAILCFFSSISCRLSPLFLPYLALMGLWAMVWQAFPGHLIDADSGLSNWIIFHIAISVITYALATIAAISALSAFIVERALKNKKPTRLSRLLPSVLDSESLQILTLALAEGVLALGILSGISLSIMETGQVLVLDHKTIFSIAAFVAVAALLYAQIKSGMRGKKASRIVLVAYLMLSLGFFGVKFVTDVMMS